KKPSELWRTDGTSCHTTLVDLFPAVVDEQVDILTVAGNDMYLGLNSEPFGNELWKFEASAISNVEVCNNIDDDCNGLVDDNPVVSISPSGTVEICKGISLTLTSDPGIGVSFQWMKNGNAVS